MNNKQRIGLAIGGGIIAVAAAVGVGAFAANLAGGGNTSGPQSGYGQGAGGSSDRQGGGRQQFDTSAMAKQLATKLGVDESKMKTALDNAMKANQPSGQPSGGAPSGGPGSAGTPGTMPSGGMPSGGPDGQGGANDSRRTERLQAMATSIASELNLDEAKVLAALQEVMGSMGNQSAQPSSQATK